LDTTAGGRSGRARIGDLVLYDLLLLLVVLGLLWGEQKLSADALERANATPPPPPPVVTEGPPPSATEPVVATTTQSPPRVTRVSTEAAPTDEGRARREVEALVREARASFDAGQVDAAFERLARADAALKASPVWAELAAPALTKLIADAAPIDAWRAVLADAQVLADAGQVAPLDALLQRWGPAPPLQKERDRAQARAALKPPTGFQIRGFVPDDAKAEGRRCLVEGGVERARLLALRDALDVLLAHATTVLGRELGEPLTFEVLAEDAPSKAPSGLTLTTHARAGEAAGDLLDRARLLAARAAVDAAAAQVATPLEPWAREALVRALAGTTPAGSAPRPSLTRPGHAWRRQALGTLTGERLVASLRAAPEPATAFALGFAALWGGPGAAPLRRALDDARAGRAATLTTDEARALAAALATLLEPS
jgi:hypothetical protein